MEYSSSHIDTAPQSDEANSEQRPRVESTVHTKPALSKRQEKKAKKKALWLAERTERKRQEKLKIKLKKQLKAQQLTDSQTCVNRADNSTSIPSYRPKPKLMLESANKTKIVIDCDFDKYMTETDVFKLIKQILRVYSINRRAVEPCQLFLTSVTGRIHDLLMKCHPGFINWDIHYTCEHYTQVFTNDREEGDVYKAKKGNIIYLSGDSENLLNDSDCDQTESRLDATKVYIIGGLVDHNHHKGLCRDIAVAHGIKTARLPIDSCQVKMTQRHILSIVNVFEILINMSTSTHTWAEALKSCIPKRKQLMSNDE